MDSAHRVLGPTPLHTPFHLKKDRESSFTLQGMSTGSALKKEVKRRDLLVLDPLKRDRRLYMKYGYQ